MSSVRPLYDKVLVKRLVESEKTPGGLIIPDTAKEKPQKGEVVAVGKGKVQDGGTLVPLEVKKGDKILFNQYVGSEFKVEEEEYLVLREDDILGILN